MDYRQELRFGLFPSPEAAAAERTLLLAEVAEVSGYDLVTLQDHPYQAKHLDALTLLTVIAARSSSLRVALNVANLPLRPPVVLAKSIATLDRLTGGRAELGLGAGAFWDAIAAAGGRRLTPGQSVDALREGIEVIRGVWGVDGSGAVRVDGEHYRVVGLHPGPAPAHPVEIWLGAYKPRMLRLTGRYADGWLPSMGYAAPDVLSEMNATIDAAARDAGRDPAGVRRLYNVMGSFGAAGGGPGLHGSPADWAEQLAALTLGEGMSTFILASDDVDVVRRFGEEVAPLVRDLVDAGRGGTAASVATPPLEPAGDDVWDESTRPRFPAPATYAYTAAQQAAPQHLVDVHDGLRAELERLDDLVLQVAEGRLTVGDARSAINRMTLRQNNWTLGAYCEQYCRIVTAHHSLEDASVFPHLRRIEGAGPVIDRLTAEHRVIHDLLEAFDRALVELVATPDGGVDRLRAVIDRFGGALRSHLVYEERELMHPLAQAGFY
ncbi:MAG: LLM class flavin-dependent oxidoreductase [Lapillicoccus sp.]